MCRKKSSGSSSIEGKKDETRITIDSQTIPPNNENANKECPIHEEKKSKLKKRNKRNKVLLLCMLFLTFGYFLVEIIVGYITNSVALVADSFHMLSDVISLIIAFAAVKISPNKWSRNTFGWARAEVLGALINAVFLVALCFTIVIDSIKRFVDIEVVKEPQLLLIVGSVGLGVNLIGLALFHDHGHSHKEGKGHSHKKEQVTSSNVDKDKEGTTDKAMSKSQEGKNSHKPNSATQMNMHGVFLHVMADALGSVVVIISALVIWLTDWKWKMYVDPSLSLIMVILIMSSVWPLFVDSAMILLQTVPSHIKIEDLKTKLFSKVSGIYQIHELHIWQLTGNRIIASAHVMCNNQEDFIRIGKEVKEFFHDEGIHSTTIQLEWAKQAPNSAGGDSSDSEEDDCFLSCPFDDEDAECVNNSCCRVPKISEATKPSTTNTTTKPSTTKANATTAKSSPSKVIQ